MTLEKQLMDTLSMLFVILFGIGVMKEYSEDDHRNI